jgi:RNA polymerase sigma-70 factor, ECF subfamily
VARQYLQDPSLAEDAVQTAMLRVIKQRGKYQPNRPFSNWFYTILRNICRDMLRGQSRQARLVREAVAAQVDRTGSASDGELETRDMLATLPKILREVLELRILGDMPFGDIAVALDISLEAAKKRAQRGLRRLREAKSAWGERENVESFVAEVPKRTLEA